MRLKRVQTYIFIHKRYIQKITLAGEEKVHKHTYTQFNTYTKIEHQKNPYLTFIIKHLGYESVL